MILRQHEQAWGGNRLLLTTELADEQPPLAACSTVHCLGFDDEGRFLLARHVERNWTIPGGHRENDESVDDALRRETYEEAAAVIDDPLLFAIERVDLLEGTPNPRYPQPSYQLFFVARVVRLDLLTPNAECVESRLFDVAEARTLPGWMDHNQALFDAGLAVALAR